MAKKTKPTKTAPKAKKTSVAAATPRQRKPEVYQRFRFQKRIKHPGPKLPSGWQILKKSLKLLSSNRRGFTLLLVIYVILSLLFVRGFSTPTNTTANTGANPLTGATTVTPTKSDTLFNNIFLATNASSQAASIYQVVLLVVFSLAIIWGIRVTYTDKERFRAKAAIYKGQAALVPFVLVFLVVCLQLIPLLIGSTIYTVVISQGLAATAVEQIIWLMVLFIGVVSSLYLVTSSVLALYVVTLPDSTPIQSLRTARELVRHRRWTVMRKIVFLPVVLLLVAVAIFVPVGMVLSGAVSFVVFLYGLVAVFVAHSYYYSLYRELL